MREQSAPATCPRTRKLHQRHGKRTHVVGRVAFQISLGSLPRLGVAANEREAGLAKGDADAVTRVLRVALEERVGESERGEERAQQCKHGEHAHRCSYGERAKFDARASGSGTSEAKVVLKRFSDERVHENLQRRRHAVHELLVPVSRAARLAAAARRPRLRNRRVRSSRALPAGWLLND